MLNFLNQLIPTVYSAGEDIIGTITLPGGVPTDVAKTGDFISAIVRFLMIVGGVFSLWQFLSGGFQFISSGGDKGKISEAQQKINMSILGLVTMTASFLIIAVISQVLFGSFTYILSPEITPIK